MEKFVTAMGGALVVIGAIFVLIPLGTLAGAGVGWLVGLFFSDSILGVANAMGIHGITMWQFGAFMGFVGSFLKTKVDATVKAAD